MLSRTFTLVIPTVTVLLASALPAGAQELGEVVVTARKYVESPQDLPIAVATFSGSALQSASTVPGEISLADLVSRLEAQITFQDLVTSERYEQALPVGERLVELTKAEFGEQSVDVAQVLAALAEIQRRAGDYDTAEKNFLTSIEMLGDEDGMFSEHLIDPLVGLATNYRHAGDSLAAMSVYNEARALYRRVFGVLNEGQIDILDRMSETLIEMSLFEEAHDQQIMALGLVERNQGTDSLGLLPAIYKYAHWLRSLGWYAAERVQYQRAVDIVKEHRDRSEILPLAVARLDIEMLSYQRFKSGLVSSLSFFVILFSICLAVVIDFSTCIMLFPSQTIPFLSGLGRSSC